MARDSTKIRCPKCQRGFLSKRAWELHNKRLHKSQVKLEEEPEQGKTEEETEEQDREEIKREKEAEEVGEIKEEEPEEGTGEEKSLEEPKESGYEVIGKNPGPSEVKRFQRKLGEVTAALNKRIERNWLESLKER